MASSSPPPASSPFSDDLGDGDGDSPDAVSPPSARTRPRLSSDVDPVILSDPDLVSPSAAATLRVTVPAAPGARPNFDFSKFQPSDAMPSTSESDGAHAARSPALSVFTPHPNTRRASAIRALNSRMDLPLTQSRDTLSSDVSVDNARPTPVVTTNLSTFVAGSGGDTPLTPVRTPGSARRQPFRYDHQPDVGLLYDLTFAVATSPTCAVVESKQPDDLLAAREELVQQVGVVFGRDVDAATTPPAATTTTTTPTTTPTPPTDERYVSLLKSAYKMRYMQLVGVADGHYAEAKFQTVDDATAWRDRRSAVLREELLAIRGKLHVEGPGPSVFGLPIPGLGLFQAAPVDISRTASLPNVPETEDDRRSRLAAESRKSSSCAPTACCLPCFGGKSKRQPAETEMPERRPRTTTTPSTPTPATGSTLDPYDSDKAAVVVSAPKVSSPRRHARAPQLSPRRNRRPRQLFGLLVRVLVQDANPTSAVPERGVGDVCDVVSQTVDPPSPDVPFSVSGASHSLGTALPPASVALLHEFASRYRISGVALHAEVLGCYAQNLAGALHENITRPSPYITDYLVSVRNAAQGLASALSGPAPPRADLLRASAVTSMLVSTMSRAVEEHNSIFYEDNPPGGLGSFLDAMRAVWTVFAHFHPDAAPLERVVLQALGNGAQKVYRESVSFLSAIPPEAMAGAGGSMGGDRSGRPVLPGDDDVAHHVLASVLLTLSPHACQALRVHPTTNGFAVASLGRAAAAANLRAGDELVRIDSRPTSGMTLRSLEALLRKASKPVQMTVQRLADTVETHKLRLLASSEDRPDVNSVELRVGESRNLLGPTFADPRLRAMFGSRVLPRVVAFWLSTDAMTWDEFEVLQASTSASTQTRLAVEAQTTSRMRGDSPDWVGEVLVIPFPHGAIDACAKADIAFGQVRILALRLEVRDDGDGSSVDSDPRSGSLVATATVAIPVWPLPPIRSAQHLMWYALQHPGHGTTGSTASGEEESKSPPSPAATPTTPSSGSGASDVGKLQLGIGFTRHTDLSGASTTSLAPSAQTPLPAAVLLKVIRSVEVGIRQSRSGAASDVFASALGLGPDVTSAVVARALYSKLRKDVLKFREASQPSPSSIPPGAFTVYRDLKSLHASMSGIRLPSTFTLLPIDQLFEPYIPGWVTKKHVEVLHTYIPRIISDDDGLPLGLAAGTRHSVAAQNLFWLCRQLLEAFTELPRSFDQGHLARFGQQLLCDPIAKFSKLMTDTVMAELAAAAWNTSHPLRQFVRPGTTPRDAVAAVRRLGVLLNNIYICRKNLLTLLGAMNNLEHVDVHSLALLAPADQEPDSDASDDEGDAAAPAGPGHRRSPHRVLAAPDALDDSRDSLEWLATRTTTPRRSLSTVGPAAGAGGTLTPADVSDQESAAAAAAADLDIVSDLSVYRVVVTVDRAAGLPRMDLGGLGRSDPFVLMSVGEQDEIETGACCQASTSVKKGTLSPVWGETFAMVAFSDAAVLRCQVYDWDTSPTAPDDYIGSTSVGIKELCGVGRVTFTSRVLAGAQTDHSSTDRVSPGAGDTIAAPPTVTDAIATATAAAAAAATSSSSSSSSLSGTRSQHGTLTWTVTVDVVKTGRVVDEFIGTQLDAAVVALARPMHAHLRPLLVSALTADDVPDALTPAYVHTALKPVTQYLDQQLFTLHKILYRDVLDLVLSHVWSGLAIEMYNLLLPGVPVDNAVSVSANVNRQKERHKGSLLFWRKPKLVWLTAAQLALLRQAYALIKSYVRGDGHGLPEYTVDSVAAPLPRILDLWDADVETLTVQMNGLYARALRDASEPNSWTDEHGVSFPHVKGILQHRVEVLGSDDAERELERTEQWPEWVPAQPDPEDGMGSVAAWAGMPQM